MLRAFNQAIGPTLVVDTGLLVEYLTATDAGAKIGEMIFTNPYIASILTSSLTLIQIYFIIRRKDSQDRAKIELEKLKKLLQIIPLDEFLEITSEVKATTSFALADSANIALAEYKNTKVLFKHEDEIDSLLATNSSSPYTKRIVFVDDFPFFQEDLPPH